MTSRAEIEQELLRKEARVARWEEYHELPRDLRKKRAQEVLDELY